SSAKDIYAFTPKNTVPNTIQLPNNFSLKGNFKGLINNFKTLLDIKSSLGNALVDATFDQSQKNNERYRADATVENFDLDTFIKNKQFGKVTANATITGRSLDPSTATATVTSNIVNITFNGYRYQNIQMDGSIDKGHYVANANVSDPNLNVVLDAQGTSDSEKPTLD